MYIWIRCRKIESVVCRKRKGPHHYHDTISKCMYGNVCVRQQKPISNICFERWNQLFKNHCRHIVAQELVISTFDTDRKRQEEQHREWEREFGFSLLRLSFEKGLKIENNQHSGSLPFYSDCIGHCCVTSCLWIWMALHLCKRWKMNENSTYIYFLQLTILCTLFTQTQCTKWFA